MDIAWIIGEICNYRSFSNKQIKKNSLTMIPDEFRRKRRRE